MRLWRRLLVTLISFLFMTNNISFAYNGEVPYEDGQYTIVVFLQDGTFVPPAGVDKVDVLVVAGGGGGGASAYRSEGAGGGGGGAGDCLSSTNYIIDKTQIPITVGQGGRASRTNSTLASNGGNSSFDNLIALGGGGGGTPNSSVSGINGQDGGSGGGGSSGGSSYGTGNKGYALAHGYGHDGGDQLANSGYWGAGGGGGAGTAGQDGDASGGGDGGQGYYFGDLFDTAYGDQGWFGGGGGGGAFGSVAPKGVGGQGGGGDATLNTGAKGIDFTGGGGGGGSYNGSKHHAGGDGGSGVVIIRYKTIDASWSDSYYLQFGDFIFGETATASAISLNLDHFMIDFDSPTPEVFTRRENNLLVNSNIPIGYSLYMQQNDFLRINNFHHLPSEQKGRATITNTSCDEQTCSPTQAGVWQNPHVSGLGYTVSGLDTMSDFQQGQWYRPLSTASQNQAPALIAQELEAQNLLHNRATQVQYQLALSGAQMAGTYQNAIMYTLVPNF